MGLIVLSSAPSNTSYVELPEKHCAPMKKDEFKANYTCCFYNCSSFKQRKFFVNTSNHNQKLHCYEISKVIFSSHDNRLIRPPILQIVSFEFLMGCQPIFLTNSIFIVSSNEVATI